MELGRGSGMPRPAHRGFCPPAVPSRLGRPASPLTVTPALALAAHSPLCWWTMCAWASMGPAWGPGPVVTCSIVLGTGLLGAIELHSKIILPAPVTGSALAHSKCSLGGTLLLPLCELPRGQKGRPQISFAPGISGLLEYPMGCRERPRPSA